MRPNFNIRFSARAVYSLIATFLLLLMVQKMEGQTPASRKWGRIANDQHQGEKIASALFFAGPPNPTSLSLYTRHPQEPERYNWATEANIAFSLKQMRDVGLNTIKLSYWGHDGEADKWSPAWLFSKKRWLIEAKPSEAKNEAETYTEAEQVTRAKAFFRQAKGQELLVAPMLEVSPEFRFYDEFPDRLDNLVNRVGWLLKYFGEESNWLRVYDQQGKPRHIIWLIETIHGSAIAPERFAQGFEESSRRLKDLGYSVGFVIDPMPLPPYGSHAGPDPQALRACPAVVAINPYNITSQGLPPQKKLSDITEEERQAYAESILKFWSASGIPLIAPIMPGYDAHIVFPDLPIYGFNAAWRQRQKELALKYETAGLSIDIWNGWTEGYAIPPSVEEGETSLKWVQNVIQSLRRP